MSVIAEELKIKDANLKEFANIWKKYRYPCSVKNGGLGTRIIESCFKLFGQTKKSYSKNLNYKNIMKKQVNYLFMMILKELLMQ